MRIQHTGPGTRTFKASDFGDTEGAKDLTFTPEEPTAIVTREIFDFLKARRENFVEVDGDGETVDTDEGDEDSYESNEDD